MATPAVTMTAMHLIRATPWMVPFLVTAVALAVFSPAQMVKFAISRLVLVFVVVTTFVAPSMVVPVAMFVVVLSTTATLGARERPVAFLERYHLAAHRAGWIRRCVGSATSWTCPCPPLSRW